MAQCGATLGRAAHRAFAAIRMCRTAALGARHFECAKCHTSHVLYNSCRNRHCSTCQGQAAHRWLHRQLLNVLPAPYFHIVFTLPPPIAQIAYANRKVVLDILMRTGAQTLTTIAADPNRFGARIGATTVLHTWNQQLRWHPHVHVVVPNAGFDVRTGQYKTGSKTFFAPVKVLAKLFRRLFLEHLDKAYHKNQLIFPRRINHLRAPEAFQRRLNKARNTDWNVYAKPPFAGPVHLLKYLSRYTHRVAIANSRIVKFDGTRVSFRYRKPTIAGQTTPRYAVMTLSATEFMKRYLMHVLPPKFHRIRHFGILANAHVKHTQQQIFAQTGFSADDWLRTTETYDTVEHNATPQCPNCQSPMLLVALSSPDQRLIGITECYLSRAPPLLVAA